MVKVKFDAEVEEVPLKVPNKFGLFINRKNVSHRVKTFSYYESQNSISYIEATISKYSADSVDFERGNRVVFVYDDLLIGSGVIKKSGKDSHGDVIIYAELIGEDGVALENSLIGRVEYIDEDNASVIRKLCSENLDGSSPWIIEPGTVDSIQQITVRAENENRLNIIQKIANDLGAYWLVSHPTVSGQIPQWWEEDRLDFCDYESSTAHPAKNSPKFTTLTTTNCREIRYTIDENKTTNYLKLMGSGDGVHQLESIIYHATDNRTHLLYGTDSWLASDIDEDDTTVTTTGNPSNIWPASTSTTTTSNNETGGVSVVIEVASTAIFIVGDYVMLDNTTKREVCKITVIDPGVSITVDKMTNDFGSGTTVRRCQVQIDGEFMAYTSRDSTTLTVKRDNTGNATSHSEGAEVIQTSSNQTIYVDDNTSLPSSGNVWVGLEKISYSGKSGTTQLTGCNRGQGWLGTNTPSSKLYYAHGANIAVWDTQYTTASPESGSSIHTYGIKSGLQIDQTIIQQNALDLAATNILDDYYIPPSSVEVVPRDNSMVKEITIGDIIAVSDADNSGADGNYRVKQIRIEKHNSGNIMATFTAGDTISNVPDEIGRLQSDFGKVSVYAQGTPQTITINSAEDCQGDNTDWKPATSYGGLDDNESPHTLFPLKLEFYIPDEAISIDQVKLDFFIEPYRAYSSTAQSATHSHTGITTDPSNSGIHVFPLVAGYMDSTFYGTGSYVTVATNYINLVDTTIDDAVAHGNIWADGDYDWDGGTSYGTRLYNDTETDSIDTCDVTFEGTTGDGHYSYWLGYNFSSTEAEEMNGSIIELHIDADNLDEGRIMVVVDVLSYFTHSHNLDINDDGAHTHSIAYGISVADSTFDDMKVAIDEGYGYVEQTTTIEDANHLNRSISTDREVNLDLTEFFGNTPGKKGIKILGCGSDTTDRYGRIFGVLRVKYYETNE